jgi:hypothetical protein
MKRDASTDESIVNSLPGAGQISFNLAAGITLVETSSSTGGFTIPANPLMRVNRANALALGFSNIVGAPSDTGGGSVDAKISFNSAYNFDYDNSDGIASQSFDFEAAAIHEIGHVLGFESEVDRLNSGNYFPMPMDLFRLAPGQGANFATSGAISSISNLSAAVVTVTTSSPHGMTSGDPVVLAGVTGNTM